MNNTVYFIQGESDNCNSYSLWPVAVFTTKRYALSFIDELNESSKQIQDQLPERPLISSAECTNEYSEKYRKWVEQSIEIIKTHHDPVIVASVSDADTFPGFNQPDYSIIPLELKE